MTDAMIRLEDLTKTFPGQEEPAVDRLSMDIREGEIVILVGPSGCGKTTTMKMINRIIEPTSGRIFLEGDDVTKSNADQLRRRIGYVIQQIGLFPHLTIHDNIATVPKLLDWDKKRIDERVDELLDLVGMDPGTYRSRYPKELSGGQRQRIGVARALAADPPVMLMDEPFGAIDPITRERLQNEFLRLQEEIKKTIVFVTHDIDEAIKMGDRIAILQAQSRIAQYDTPEIILSSPANEFVAEFVGSGAALKRLNLTQVRDFDLKEWPTARLDDNHESMLNQVRQSDRGALLLLDSDDRPRRWLSPRDIQREAADLSTAGLEVVAVPETASLADALDEMLRSRFGNAVVIDNAGRYRGTVDMQVVMNAAETLRRSERERAREGFAAEPSDEAHDEQEVSG